MPMLSHLGPGLAVLLCLAAAARAQEFSVYTRTVDLSTESIKARSKTIFHAGKVYDCVDPQADSPREVIIYDPGHRRFFIIEESRSAYAEVTFDEIRRFLGLAEDKAREVASDLISQPSLTAPDAGELLQVQLQPQFVARYDEPGKRLRLESPRFLYEAVCTAAPQPAVLDSYLKYADAIAELNSVLHPQSLLPSPRWQLNRELRERGVLPVSVRRRLEFGPVSDLKAEHEWSWTLRDHDRQLISHWESLLSGQTLRPMPFKQLQQAVLGGGLEQK
ncbi:MAG: hypothetical protein SH850_06605 [Planctomycetaceae bacterium]|nr:hypothetical protein [Planctomycetaceae bacterium]